VIIVEFRVNVQTFQKIGHYAAVLWPKITFYNMASVRHFEFKTGEDITGYHRILVIVLPYFSVQKFNKM